MIMISVIEKEYMETVIRMGKRLQRGEIDWEQRRYEIAKEVMSSIVGAVVNGAIDKGAMYDPNYTSLARTSVEAASALVNELKKTQDKK
jgi:hypothetical protein|nr:MAG TPA: hypothetical protein [Caudoviricetes sp.]